MNYWRSLKKFSYKELLTPGKPARWFILSILVGIISGLGASLFFLMFEWLRFFFMGVLGGYSPPTLASEDIITMHTSGVYRPWILALLPVIGGFISGWLVYKFAPQDDSNANDGTDAMINSFHNQDADIPTRVPYIKGIAAIFTLSSGGSAGKEGPISQIGAGFGSWLGKLLKVTTRERRSLMLAGSAGGLGAIFRAPLGGALTAVEVLYKEDFEAEALVPCIISSVVAYSTFTFFFGNQPILTVPKMVFTRPLELIFYILLGFICAGMGVVYVKIFHTCKEKFFKKLPIKSYLIPAIGGIGVGIIGFFYPHILSTGAGWIQEAIRGNLPLKLMALIALLKMVATSLTVGSGASGGLFGPTLFIGAMIGGVVGGIFHEIAPNIIVNPQAFALVGMASFFAGVANAPVASLVMVCEMTGSYGLLVPLLIVSVIATILIPKWSIYRHQLMNKFSSPAHLGDSIINVLKGVSVKNVYNKEQDLVPLPVDMPLANICNLFSRTKDSFFPVVDKNFNLVGILSLPKLRPIIFEDSLYNLLVVGELMEPPFHVSTESTLYEAMLILLDSGYDQVPVIDTNDEIRGVLHFNDLMKGYHNELMRLKYSEK